MAFRSITLVLAIAAAVVSSIQVARAQSFVRGFSGGVPTAAGQETITATGAASLKRKPTVLRMYLELIAKGSTLDEAMKKMKQRREGAVAQLETLKADKNATTFGDLGLSSAKSPRQRQIETMIAARMQSRGKKAAKNQAPQPVAVTVLLTAQWTLDAEAPEQMLVVAQTLQDKIKAADLAGSKDAEKLSPEEQEVLDESAQMMDSSGEQQTPPGQPYFVFVAKISKADGEKLLAEAFAKAKVQAADLAKAAGVELGPLVGLSGQYGGQHSLGENEYNPYDNYSPIRRMLAQLTTDDDDESGQEAMSNDPASISFKGYVQASFHLGAIH
jgi:hypothetical protein